MFYFLDIILMFNEEQFESVKDGKCTNLNEMLFKNNLFWLMVIT